MTRREKFRAYMTRVAAAASPSLAIEQHLYVHPPSASSDLIVARLEIDPSSRHLVVGGIGSGKTTQLLKVQERLNGLGDVVAEYIDVSEKQDLAQAAPGCLVALAGLKLIERMREAGIKWTVKRAGLSLQAFEAWALGGDSRHFKYQSRNFVEGVVRKEWSDIPEEYVVALQEFHNALSEQGKAVVLLFDSLDRMTSRDAFAKIVEQDIAALKSARTGVVLVGPIRSLAGFGRLDADKFDYLHVQPPVDVEQDIEGRRFLLDVLQRRAGVGMLSEQASQKLVEFSGGVLRDLIQLAKAAGDEAYLRGDEGIDVTHVLAAVDGFGRALMVGLKPSEVKTLKHLHSTGGFVRMSDDDLALIATRRILQYRANRYVVHPTIVPLLEHMAESA